MVVPTSLVPWGLELRPMPVELDSQGFEDHGTAAEAASFGRHAGYTMLARRR